MKIIDNKKDYYDYLVSYYGLDEYVVYDRRGSKKLSKELESYLRKEVYPYDEDGIITHMVTLFAGEQYKNIYIERITDVKNRIREFKFYSEEEWLKLHPRFSILYSAKPKSPVTKTSPLVFTMRIVSSRKYCWIGPYSKYDVCIENPILADSPFTSIMAADEIWQGIYNYLLKCKEPDIVDNRNDIQHLESHGFDRKTSFRNVK